MRARLAAALSKFLPSPLSRQAISRTPRLIVLSKVSSHCVQRRGRPLVGRMPAPPPESHPAVDRQHGEVLPSLIALGPAGAPGPSEGGKAASAASTRICTAIS